MARIGVARVGVARVGVARVGVVVCAAAALAACAPAGAGDAPAADAPECTALLGRLPAQVLGLPRLAENTGGNGDGEGNDGEGNDGQARWGDGDAEPIRLTCGYPAEDPTSDQCLSVDGVDWVFEDGDTLVFRSYGTNPSVRVTVPSSVGRENATGALVDLTTAVKALPPSGRACIG